MTEKECRDKIGAMHLRFMDHPRYYAECVNLLSDYSEQSANYGNDVTSALRNGLDNADRYLQMESAISLRSVVIEKRKMSKGLTLSKKDVEGNYRLSFILDDGSKLKMRFDRKQSHLLYILIVLCSWKNGLLADFFLSDDHLDTVIQLIQLIYPHMDDRSARLMARELSPNHSFSDIFQKMKAPLNKCLRDARKNDDLYWFMPYAVNLEKKRLYKMRLPQPQMVFPPEFAPIIKALPDANDWLSTEESETRDTVLSMSELMNDFAWWKVLAEEGDASGLFHLGVFYATGDVVTQSYQKANGYFEQAHQKGYLDATFQLGVHHMFGFGFDKDIHQALSYFEEAAAKGHAEAATYAGQIYDRGTDGITINHKKSFNLYMVAAKQDVEEAMWYVIQGYLLGQGTEKDFNKAYEWFQKAEALGYENIKTLFGIHYFNQGDKESLRKALSLFLDGCKADVPMAFYFMGRMAAKGFCRSNDSYHEMEEWFLKGALHGDQMSKDTLEKHFSLTYAENQERIENRITLRDILIDLVLKMNPMEWEPFIQLVDAYRERWQGSYLTEICKQLSIHKKSEGQDGNQPAQRRITIRKSESRKPPYYNIILTLGNGEEIVIDKINAHCLVLYLLTIICSFKRGYTTLMAVDPTCRPLLKTLVQLVMGNHINHLDDYVEGMMGYEKDVEKKRNEDYYKQYSNLTKNAIKKAVDVRDDAIYFLFDNIKTTGRKNLRRINLDTQYIDLPQELMNLAARMPDAEDIIQQSVNQEIGE